MKPPALTGGASRKGIVIYIVPLLPAKFGRDLQGTFRPKGALALASMGEICLFIIFVLTFRLPAAGTSQKGAPQI